MQVSIQGLDHLMSTLKALDNKDLNYIVEEVADKAMEAMEDYVPVESGSSRGSIGVDSKKKYSAKSTFISIGLSNNTGSWDSWKGAYFQNYGYHNLGRGGIYHGTYHKGTMWFNNFVDSNKNNIEQELMNKVRAEIRRILYS